MSAPDSPLAPADVPPAPRKRKSGLKKWGLFVVRWGIAVVGVWIVASRMTVRDQAWVILDHTTNRPVRASLQRAMPDDASVFAVYDPATGRPVNVPRVDVVNEADAKSVTLKSTDGPPRPVQLLALDLRFFSPTTPPQVVRLLVADAPTTPAYWVSPSRLAEKYVPRTPYPADQVGLESMVRGAMPAYLWLALLVFPITFVVTSYRWHELLKAVEIPIPLGRAFTLNMVGAFYNSFMPGSTGGDALKAWYAAKQTPFKTRAVMSVLVDRVIGLLALIVVGGAAAATQWEVGACRKVALAAAAVLAMTAVGLVVFYNRTLHRLCGLDFILKRLPLQRQVASAVETMHLYGRRPALAAWALVVSLPVHAAVVSSAMFAGIAFGLPLHWAYYWVAVPVIVLAGAIPISPQGVGVMEGFAILLTRHQGVTVSQAFALTMSIRVVQILWNLSGGIFVLRGGYHGPNEKEREDLDPATMLPTGPGSEPAVVV